MSGTFLFLVLFLAIARRLQGWPPAARVAFAAALSVALPVFALSLLARMGIDGTALPVLCIFGVLTGLTFVRTPRIPQSSVESAGWPAVAALALLVATLTALFGRPPTMDPLVDPWAHLAWSRDLSSIHRLYSLGFPAFCAIVGLDDRLVGAFRFAPMLLHAALAAQFMALGERFGKLWPGAVAAFAFLVVPVAFGKFEPPRPILLAAVFIAASWWVVIFDGLPFRWRLGVLGFFTCVTVTTHASILELTYLCALAIAILAGGLERKIARRLWLVLVVGIATAAGIAVSPYPLWLFLKPHAQVVVTDASMVLTAPRLIDLARMWGLGLGVAAAASAVWIAFHFRAAWTKTRGVLLGAAVWFVLCLTPIALTAAGMEIATVLEAFRFVLAASLPLAMAVAIIAGFAGSCRANSTPVKAGLMVGVLAIILDICLRPGFVVTNGLIAAGLAAAIWAIVRRPVKPVIVASTTAVLLALAIAVRLVIWFPSPPPETVWLKETGNPNHHVVTNWPLTNALDALVPQPVIDGLAGADANIGLHRATVSTSLRDRLHWCDDWTAGVVDTLRAALGEMDALPGYLVVGNAFDEAWRVYADQRSIQPETATNRAGSFFAARPCAGDSATRLQTIHATFDSHPAVTRRFDSETVTIFEIQ